jgi:hypothetical protein
MQCLCLERICSPEIPLYSMAKIFIVLHKVLLKSAISLFISLLFLNYLLALGRAYTYVFFVKKKLHIIYTSIETSCENLLLILNTDKK